MENLYEKGSLGESVRKDFFGRYYDDYFLDQLDSSGYPEGDPDGIRFAVEAALFEMARDKYLAADLLSGAEDEEGLAQWAYYTRIEVERGLWKSADEISSSIDEMVEEDRALASI